MAFAEDILTLITGAVSLLSVYLISLAVYRIYFDPLSKFPGPKLAAFTSKYFHYYALTGQRAAKVRELHEKYGEIVRIAPNQLSFISETAWKDIYGHKQGRKQLQKIDRAPIFVNGAPVFHILDAPDDIHARQRKMLAHSFSDRALREQESLLKQYVDLMIRNLHEDAQKNKVTDIIKSYNGMTFDFIGDFAFAEPFENLKTRIDHPFMLMIFHGARAGDLAQTLIGIFPPLQLMTRYLRTFLSSFDYAKFVHEKVENRIQNGNRERPDLMTGILKHNTEDGTGIARDEIEATAAVLIGAGSETTATLLSGCTYLLLSNPRALKKLQDEIRGSFATSDEIAITKLNQLPYLLAVLEESLRLYPPVPVALPRVTPPEGIPICGHFVPGNVIVGVPHYAAYISENHFADALEFVPERHLPDRPAKYENDKRHMVQPFSVGPRNCLGRNLAYTEMKLMLARVIYDFDLELADESKNWRDQKVWTLWEKGPLCVRLKERA